MSEQSAETRGGILKWALWGVALVGVVAVVYITGKSAVMPRSAQPPAKAVAAATSGDVAAKMEHPSDGQPGPDYAFLDAAGKPVKIADLKGKVVVLNLWATWCAPCKIEMPTLAKLQADYAGQPVAVVAVSIDKAEALDAARAFIGQHAPLSFYNDPEAKMPWALKPLAAGMPTTVIYGKDGLERGRVSGEADWGGAGAKRVIDKVLAES